MPPARTARPFPAAWPAGPLPAPLPAPGPLPLPAPVPLSVPFPIPASGPVPVSEPPLLSVLLPVLLSLSSEATAESSRPPGPVVGRPGEPGRPCRADLVPTAGKTTVAARLERCRPQHVPGNRQ